jgi:hypothetical protein
MKKILASILLISFIICCSNFNSNNDQKPKRRYGEKILVYIR